VKARIVVMSPEKTQKPPLVPTLVVENEGILAVCGDGWARPLHGDSLEAVTTEDIRTALRLPDALELYLSAPRSLPSADLLSEPFLKWAQEWWAAESAELQKEPIRAGVS
jgi:hypothetical protein